MAAEWNLSGNLGNIIRRKMVRMPNLTPKTKLGQRTLGKDPATTKQYQELKSEYYASASADQPSETRAALNTFIRHLRGRILTNNQLLAAPSGIYTWIIKRGNIYASPLMTNQEIGSLHINIDTLTINANNLGAINRNTLKNIKNKNGAIQRAIPNSAGELLLTRAVDGVEVADGPIRIYFNIQSGTFSEPLLKCRVKTLAEQRGINTKSNKNAASQLKMECRDGLLDQISQTMSAVIGVPLDQIRFLHCDESIQRELEAVPLLNQGDYQFGPCREDEDYFESLAGRNLIRRVAMYTSSTNRNKLNTYFTNVPRVSSYGKAPKPKTKKNTPYSEPKKGGKRRKTRKTRKIHKRNSI